MSSAIGSHGTLLKIGDGGSPTEVFTTIAEVLDINPPPIEQQHEEVTSQDSAGWYETLPVLLQAGDVTFDVNFIPTHATQNYSAGLIKDAVDLTLRNFQVVFPDTGTTTWQFAAYVRRVATRAPVKGVLRGSVTLSPSGQPTLAG